MTLFKIKDYIEKNHFRMTNRAWERSLTQENSKPMIELGNIFNRPKGNPHYPRDVVRLNGDVFVRGTVRHPAEHGTLRLGEQWHLVRLNYIKRAYQPNGRVD